MQAKLKLFTELAKGEKAGQENGRLTYENDTVYVDPQQNSP